MCKNFMVIRHSIKELLAKSMDILLGMLKVTKCIGVKSFVEALINMVCELKITPGSRTTLSQDVQT